MKTIIGTLLIIAGAAAGLYFGLWWAFIGGIVAVINEIRADDLSALNVACGVARVIFAGAIGWLAALLVIAPGVALMKN